MLALFAVLALPQSGAAAITGEQRLLVMLVTWGPEPFTAEHAQRVVFDETAEYIRSASFGRATITGQSIGWVHGLDDPPSGCELGLIESAGRAAAAARGLNPASFDRLVFGMPEMDCGWGGAYYDDNVWANGRFDRHLVAHELGHIYGIHEEGPAWICSAGGCRMQLYGNPYSVMGHGWGDFNAFEKFAYGWIDVARPTRGSEVDVAAIDRASQLPHALVVTTAGNEYWLEYRSPEPRFDYREDTATPGLVVHAGPNGLPLGRPSPFPSRNLLLTDPAGLGRPSVAAGESFRVPGAFSASVVAASSDLTRVRFTWLDRARPERPRILSAGRGRAAWRSGAERGSGIERFELRVDRRPPVLVRVDALSTQFVGPNRVERGFPMLQRGRHRVTVVAVDRAGNRSRAAVRAFRIR